MVKINFVCVNNIILLLNQNFISEPLNLYMYIVNKRMFQICFTFYVSVRAHLSGDY